MKKVKINCNGHVNRISSIISCVVIQLIFGTFRFVIFWLVCCYNYVRIIVLCIVCVNFVLFLQVFAGWLNIYNICI